MTTIVQVHQEIGRMTDFLQARQLADGSWRFCFEDGILTDAYMIVLLKTLRIDDQKLLTRLSERIARRQEKNGSWKLFRDEQEGNVSATIQAYYALLFSGFKRKEDSEMKLAKAFILKHGGVEQAHILTKLMLTLTGQYPWSSHTNFPIEVILLPPDLFISFYDLAGFTRVHVAPILIASELRFFIKTRETPDISDLFTSRRANHEHTNFYSGDRLLQAVPKFLEFIQKHIAALPKKVKSYAMQQAKEYMLQRIEPDGLLYSYFSCTFLMIFALLGLGYSQKDPVIQRALEGMKELACKTADGLHMENSTSTVWDTALLSYALQEAGTAHTQPMIQRANRYLLSRQQTKEGDWKMNNSDTKPGGWGFSDHNTIHPDVDDSTAALRALYHQALDDTETLQSWQRGRQWVLSMQNDDGGWAAFERNKDLDLSEWVPYEGMHQFFIDPSTADLTGRTLEFLGNYASPSERGRVDRGVEWLLKHQNEDGTWSGRWGICMIYGTWAAVTGLRANGVSPQHPAVRKAVRWLESVQNADGGWGESCKSDIQGSYVPLGASTPSQTAWAVDALIAVSDEPTEAINRGIQYLIHTGEEEDWTTRYPTGTGLTGGFYIHYHSYRYIWPLLALGKYKKKYSNL